jgi:predicted PurR-regulated permease PerM
VIDGAVGLGEKMDEGTLKIPPPEEKVKDWPLIGERTYAVWNGASRDLDGTVSKLAPQLKKLGGKVAGLLASAGGAVLQSVFSVIIAGILLMNSAGAGRTANSIGRALAGDGGPKMVELSVGTIRSVVKGVLAVAALQSILALIGFYIASVPAAAFWALLVMILAIMQLPPVIILGPIAVWVLSANDNQAIAIFFLIYSLIVSGADGWLKPLFLGRGVEVPMLVILIGAIGGMLSSGVIGLFVGAVILAIAHTLVRAWMVDAPEETAGEAPAKPEPAT